MTENPNRPWWAEIIPDIRAWATVGMFAIVFYLLHLVATVPALKENELFKTLATLLVGSGAFGLVCAFLWGGSKTTAAASETVSAIAKASAVQPAPQPAPVVPPAGEAAQ